MLRELVTLPCVDREGDSVAVRYGKKLVRLPLRAMIALRLAANRDLPWMAPGAVARLREYLEPSMTGFEWGSGGSTAFLGRRLAELTSVEHDAGWYAVVHERLANGTVNNVNLALVPPGHSENADAETEWDLDGYVPRKPEFSAYFNYIRRFDDAFFDLVVVDGRARVACVINAASKVKPRGVLLLDNTERSEYREASDRLKTWEKTVYTDWMTETTIFQRP